MHNYCTSGLATESHYHHALHMGMGMGMETRGKRSASVHACVRACGLGGPEMSNKNADMGLSLSLAGGKKKRGQKGKKSYPWAWT
jgi:hypothetical protein